MKAALFFQAVSLAVGILSVPLFLHYLSSELFLTWIMFATIGTFTIQVENALQVLSVRRIAHEWYQGRNLGFIDQVSYAKNRFRILSLLVFIVVGPLGFLYFSYLDRVDFTPTIQVTWFVFCLSFSINYFFGANNCTLLATDNTTYFNYSNAISRSINFCLSAILLWSGLSVFGLSLSFVLGVIIGCTIIAHKSRQVLAINPASVHHKIAEKSDVETNKSNKKDIIYFTLFTISAFVLYRGALLIATALFAKENLSSYGLLLQVMAVVYMVSIIPTQVRLGRLILAITERSEQKIYFEILFNFGFAFLMYGAAFIGLVFFVPPALDWLESSVQLPGKGAIAMMIFAFLSETLIFNLVNILVMKKNFQFVRPYAILSMVALLIGISSTLVGVELYIGMALIPASIQISITLPIIYMIAVNELGLQPTKTLRNAINNRR